MTSVNTITTDEMTLILEGLAKLPLERSFELFVKVREWRQNAMDAANAQARENEKQALKIEVPNGLLQEEGR